MLRSEFVMRLRTSLSTRAAFERLAYAIAFSATAHVAALANLSFASPWQGDGSKSSGPRLVVRLASGEHMPAQEGLAASKSDAARANPAATADPPAPEHYYRASELHERAVPLNQVDMQYPERALAQGISGRVTLRLLIDRKGVLRDVRVLDAEPAGVFEEAALKSVRSLIFRPAMRNGKPVGSIKTIEVPFYPDCRRTGSCIASQPESAQTAH